MEREPAIVTIEAYGQVSIMRLEPDLDGNHRHQNPKPIAQGATLGEWILSALDDMRERSSPDNALNKAIGR